AGQGDARLHRRRDSAGGAADRLQSRLAGRPLPQRRAGRLVPRDRPGSGLLADGGAPAPPPRLRTTSKKHAPASDDAGGDLAAVVGPCHAPPYDVCEEAMMTLGRWLPRTALAAAVALLGVAAANVQELAPG